ncbi:MAG TPA: GNAT family N-acetyltransferase [Solirubrobacteraceae bacterium]|nr:GNAT family N-acetyltransferase [Solirubrobacteraceae bacterium]
MAADPVTLETERLLLRPWRAADRPPFAALNADEQVMEWFPYPLDAAQSDMLADAIEQRIAANAWGMWAVEVVGVADFIGFVGLNHAAELLGYPAVEVGWRLAREHWGHGYAPEAAIASLAYGFDVLELGEIVAFTTPGNLKSRRVMEKIGMSHDGARDFDHPRIAPDSPLLRQVLYKIDRDSFARHRDGLTPAG